MSRQGWNGSNGKISWPAPRVVRVTGGLLAVAACFTAGPALAQNPAAQPGPESRAARPITLDPASPSMPATATTTAPGAAAGGPAASTAGGNLPVAPAGFTLDPAVQVVRFQGPPGLSVEVLSPPTVPVPIGDGGGIVTVGLKRGVGYRLKISNLPERPGRELYPVIELVGHLHRPEATDPGKYPIRITFRQYDLDDVADHNRMVTKIVYLEDPDQAIPFHLPKDEVPVLTLGPTESPLRVAQAPGTPRCDRSNWRRARPRSTRSNPAPRATSASTGPRASAPGPARS